MTGRERVLAAFRHRAPDRTPFFEKLVKPPCSDVVLGRPHAAVNFEYRMQRLADDDWRGLVEQEAQDEFDLARILDFDMIRLGPNIGPDYPRPIRLADHTWRVGDTVHYLHPDSEVVESWPADRDRGWRPDPAEDETERLRWTEADYEPPGWTDDHFYVFRRVRQLMAEAGLDLAIFCSCYTMPVAALRPVQLLWFTDRPDALHRFYEKQSQFAVDMGRRAVAEGAHVIGLGGDLACDKGPIISPRHYREFVVPHVARQAAAMHALGVPVTNASDGNLWPLLDLFLLDTGVDGFEEIDYAAGMDLAALRARYPQMTFIGNMDCRYILTRGTREQVRQATFDCLDKGRSAAGGPGGHVLMSSNCIHKDVKPESFFVMVAAYREYWGRPALDLPPVTPSP